MAESKKDKEHFRKVVESFFPGMSPLRLAYEKWKIDNRVSDETDNMYSKKRIVKSYNKMVKDE